MFVEKRGGHCEKFEEKKAYDIFCRSALNAHLSAKEAEQLANKAVKDLKRFLKGKKKIKSSAVFKQNIKILRKYNKDVAFLYETHRDIS